MARREHRPDYQYVRPISVEEAERARAGWKAGGAAPGKAALGAAANPSADAPSPAAPALVMVRCNTCDCETIVGAAMVGAWETSHQGRLHFGRPWAFTTKPVKQ